MRSQRFFFFFPQPVLYLTGLSYFVRQKSECHDLAAGLSDHTPSLYLFKTPLFGFNCILESIKVIKQSQGCHRSKTMVSLQTEQSRMKSFTSCLSCILMSKSDIY